VLFDRAPAHRHGRAIEAVPHCSMRAAEMGASEILQALRPRSGSG
jgi:hypothetical protein